LSQPEKFSSRLDWILGIFRTPPFRGQEFGQELRIDNRWTPTSIRLISTFARAPFITPKERNPLVFFTGTRIAALISRAYSKKQATRKTLPSFFEVCLQANGV
ncbi:MAG: hypothetical protein P8Y12_07160, partial [Gammaproteobacteria bacterium]